MFIKRVTLTQKNFLLFLYIIILAVFAPAIYWISHSERQPQVEVKPKNPIHKRISIGDKILVTAHRSAAKQAGIAAFAEGNYVTAMEKFDSALAMDANDPESLIYFNNAIAAKTEAPYKIAVSVPIGGNLYVAQEILRGVAQAQNEIYKEGGINGKLVVVEIANDDNDSDTAIEIAKKFVDDEEIKAVIGHNTSNTSLAVAPVYQNGELVMISPTSSVANLPKQGSYIFRSTPGTRGLSKPLADHAVNDLSKTNIAICFDSKSEAIKSFKDEFTWSVFDQGGRIAPVDCDFSSPNFMASEIPSKVVSSGADALLLAPSLRSIDDAIAVANANEERLTLLGSHTLNTYATLKQGQASVNGMALAVAWNSQIKPKNDFAADARKLWGGSVNWRTAMAYDAAQTVFEGLRNRDSRQGLQQALTNPDFYARGATSQISFLPTGDRNLQGTLIKIQPGKNSGTGFDFVPLKRNKAESKPLNQFKPTPKTSTTSPQRLTKQVDKLGLR